MNSKVDQTILPEHVVQWLRPTALGAASLLSVFGGAAAAQSQFLTGSTCPLQAQVVEWDLPQGGTDNQPGAIFVDIRSSSDSSVWFVTRNTGVADNQKVYKLQLRDRKNPASFTSWTLDGASVVTGGLRRVHASEDARFVIVRTLNLLELVDTQKCTTDAAGTKTCERLDFLDQPGALGVSDVATDSQSNVFTAATTPVSETTTERVSYVQRLKANAVTQLKPGVVTANVIRWNVGGGAGTCQFAGGLECIAGVATKRGDSRFVYFSSPADNSVGELDTQMDTVRRFPLSTVAAAEPRQIDVDEEGIVWVVTGSDHLVRIDPRKKVGWCTSSNCAAMSSHRMPGAANDPFGVTIDRGGRRGRNEAEQFRNEVVGYTATGSSEVGLLIPDGKLFPVEAKPNPAPRDPETVTGDQDRATQETGNVFPDFKKVTVVPAPDNGDGLFLEAEIFEKGSFAPLGITPDRQGRFGTFYYAVGEPMPDEDSAAVDPLDPAASVLKRIERITFPRVARRPDNPRDKDDYDDDGIRDDKDTDRDDDGVSDSMDKDWDNDCVVNEMDDDDDGDHLEDKYDRPDRQEQKRTEWAPTAGGTSNTYTVTTTSSTTLITVVATASDLGMPISIEIVDPLGVVVMSAVPTPGTALATTVPLRAGNYTVRVKNNGLTSVGLETLLITQSLPLM